MKDIVYLTPDFAITGDLAPADFAAAASLGFKAILNNRPDGEEEYQLTGATEAELAWRAGLKYRFLPLDKHELFTDPVVEGMIHTIGELDGPILAHCKSGLRSAIVWAAASARTVAVDDVLAMLQNAGQELDFLRDELDAQADRHRWMPDTIASPADTVAKNSKAGAAELAA